MNALFVGRFQPFHNGHLLVLQHISKQYDGIILGMGSSQYAGTVENPFSADEREQMIHQSLKGKGVENYRIVRIADIHDPPNWVSHVLSLVSDFDVVLSNNPLTKQLFSEKGYAVKGTQVFKRKTFSGTEIRRRMIQGEPWEELVPFPVVIYIKKINGVQRIQKLSK